MLEQNDRAKYRYCRLAFFPWQVSVGLRRWECVSGDDEGDDRGKSRREMTMMELE